MLTKVIEKACSRCKKVLPASEFYPHRRMKSGLQSHCRTCARQWHLDRPEYVQAKNASYKAANPDYSLNWARRQKFGLTPEQVEVMRVQQNGTCAGCQCALARANECIDHCHVTGKVRGLLCKACNIGLGMFKDQASTLRRMADYVERAEAEAY